MNHPGATGSIRLENCNPLNDPLITLAIHEETHDQARMVEGLATCLCWRSPALCVAGVKKAMEILGNNKMAPLLDGYERSAVELVGADDAAITAWVQKRGAHGKLFVWGLCCKQWCSSVASNEYSENWRC